MNVEERNDLLTKELALCLVEVRKHDIMEYEEGAEEEDEERIRGEILPEQQTMAISVSDYLLIT